MVLKDWKKIRGYSWVNIKHKKATILIQSPPGDNEAGIFISNNSGKEVIEKYLSSTKKALAYAKAYMRKH